MCNVTPETLVWLALLVPGELADAPAADEDDDDEQAATPKAARQAATATARVKRAPERARTSVRIIIVVPP
jgi:hypothetical protein